MWMGATPTIVQDLPAAPSAVPGLEGGIVDRPEDMDAMGDYPHVSPKPGAGAVRVLLGDGHELVRTALACLLERCGYEVVGLACSGPEAVELWQRLTPDVALLDLRLPVMDGIATIRAIRAMDSAARLVVLSPLNFEEPVRRAFSAGGRGYLLKTASPRALCSCLETVCRGGRFLSAELAHRIVADIGHPTPTRREIEVLGGVARGLRNKHIGKALGINEETVKTHVRSIMRKLDADSRTQAAAIAIQRGLVEL